MKHYIAMAGLHGCLPNYCDAYHTKHDAVESLIDSHELRGTRKGYIGSLRNDGYTELDLYEHGNEYAEVIPCDCNEPWIHSDDIDYDYWMED